MYQLGWAKVDLGIEPAGRAMNGYGMWNHRARRPTLWEHLPKWKA